MYVHVVYASYRQLISCVYCDGWIELTLPSLSPIIQSIASHQAYTPLNQPLHM